jgi:hypothetical protein
LNARRLLHVVASFAVLALPRVAAAANDACIAAHHDVQIARRDHRLLDAERAAQTCAQSACPNLVGADCRQWLVEIESLVPTVVFDARRADGRSLPDVRISIDGAAQESAALGRGVPVDPGQHVFRFEAGGYAPAEITSVVLEGQRAQPIRATLSSLAPALTVRMEPTTEPTPSKGPPVASFVLGGIGVVALGVSAGFGIDGLSRRSALDDLKCRPNCNSDRVSLTQRSFLIADISLAVGVASLAAAAVLWIVRPTTPNDASATATWTERATGTFRF